MKTLTSILLILNPIFGFLIFYSLWNGGWSFLLIPILILLITLNLKLFFKFHPDNIENNHKDINTNNILRF